MVVVSRRVKLFLGLGFVVLLRQIWFAHQGSQLPIGTPARAPVAAASSVTTRAGARASGGSTATAVRQTNRALPPSSVPANGEKRYEDVIEEEKRHEDVMEKRHGDVMEKRHGDVMEKRHGDVMAFYYMWYRSVEHDREWQHWNHRVLEHWTPSVNRKYPLIGTKFSPPEDIGANYYPSMGLYSSLNVTAVRLQFEDLLAAGVDVVVLSWHGVSGTDGEKVDTNLALPVAMEAAEATGMGVALHLEPYEGRSAESVRRDLEYFFDLYGSSVALHRSADHGNRPYCFVYDSYNLPPKEWALLLGSSGSVRGTRYDCIFIGLYLDATSEGPIVKGGFDGVYTYFASTAFTKGSTPSQWKQIGQWAGRHSLEFIPSVGPGYVDTKIRPWNAANTRSREAGKYYADMWQAACAATAGPLSITSYNEWHEGTQIEPARAHSSFMQYERGDSMYMDLTRELVEARRRERRD